ncbi:hypothetical protein V2E39_21280 [Chryseobacterium arthrosphaerae]|uniref:Uncharacterized protein n=1 Tax=Chryseobacterium arthrosphaerae TaxID=651561 RepID=A0ABU7R562_9FLAO|nr:hypothetical protein [Chryseobacterium arthrosphaerae]QUY53748.1 hypothetical protein I2F65_12725 [Chryseobacterium arthrosphaerae]UEQ78253.1 hypothetical protein J8N07_08155 [Chryseobacterium arthrosphaerae]WES99633.1 hypothetical protein P2W68_08405 [Chryseobacterium arthrosphaerae]
MNKNNFDSYLCTIKAALPAQQNCSAVPAFSQHDLISQYMCSDMMCPMMMS